MDTMALQPIGPHIGDIVGYVERKPQGQLSWYLVHCVGKADTYVGAALRRFGIEDYYPMIREFALVPRKQLSRKQREAGVEIRRPMLVPLMPRYRLVHIDPARPDLEMIFATSGIGGLVCNQNMPVVASADLMARIKAREQEGAIPGTMTARMIFAIGDRVRVTDGPFASFDGTVEERLDVAIEDLDPEMRIKVAIEIFGRPTPVELTVEQVRKL